MDKFVTKRNVAILNGVGVLVFVLLIVFLPSPYHCGTYEKLCDSLGNFALFLLIAPPLFLFSLVTYKMRDEVYQAWWRLTRWWIPISMLLVLITPEDNGAFMQINRGFVAFLMSGLFSILSIAIILSAFVASQKKKT